MIELRDWKQSDAEALTNAFRLSGDLETQIGCDDLPLDDAAKYIQRVLSLSDSTARNFAISDNGRAVGNVSISHIEHRHDSGWVSYWVSAETRGRGVATMAVATAANWAFSEASLFRLELGHRVNNPASCVVARRSGFLSEGIERAKLKYGTKRFDVETHGRLSSDRDPEVEILAIR